MIIRLSSDIDLGEILTALDDRLRTEWFARQAAIEYAPKLKALNASITASLQTLDFPKNNC